MTTVIGKNGNCPHCNTQMDIIDYGSAGGYISGMRMFGRYNVCPSCGYHKSVI